MEFLQQAVGELERPDIQYKIAAYTRDFEEKNHVFHTQLTWKGWYPVFESQLDYGNNPQISKFGKEVANPSEIQPGLRFSNTISVPLSYSPGRFYQFIRPSLTSDYLNNYVYIQENGSYDYGQNIISGRLYFSNYHSFAYRDIYPRWGQIFDMNYSFAPSDRNIYGSEISVRTSFYFPGFFPCNGIKIRYEKEKQNPEKFMLGSRVSLPRGYNNIISKDKTGFNFGFLPEEGYKMVIQHSSSASCP